MNHKRGIDRSEADYRHFIFVAIFSVLSLTILVCAIYKEVCLSIFGNIPYLQGKHGAVLPDDGSYLGIDVFVVDVDLVNNEITFCLNFYPHGSFVGKNGALARQIKIFTNSFINPQIVLEADKKARSHVIATNAAVKTSHLVDKHSTILQLRAVMGQSEHTATSSKINDVPVKMHFKNLLHDGFILDIDFSGQVQHYNPDNNTYTCSIHVEGNTLIKILDIIVTFMIYALNLYSLYHINVIIFRANNKNYGHLSVLLLAFCIIYPLTALFLGVARHHTFNYFIYALWCATTIATLLLIVEYVVYKTPKIH
ncbi:membrane hypothetical protein [Alphaproteobacteria bacterium]